MINRESIRWQHRKCVRSRFSQCDSPIKPYRVDTAGVTELVHSETKSRVKDLEPAVATSIF